MIAQRNRKKTRRKSGGLGKGSLSTRTRKKKRRKKDIRVGRGIRSVTTDPVCIRPDECGLLFNSLHLIFTDNEEEDALDEDDLELLEENTGASQPRRLTRIRPGRDAQSPPVPSSSRARAVVESSDEDLDNDDFPRVNDIHNIWDDERAAAGRDDDDVDMDDMDNFIEYEDEEEAGGAMDESEREERRRERRRLEKARRRAFGSRPELAGIDQK